MAESLMMLESLRSSTESQRFMADIFSRTKRSWLMGRVRQRNTRPEMIIRRFLRSRGFKFRAQVKRLPGTPDVVLSEIKTAVFVNGCFWHQHARCSRAALPKTNRSFWVAKLRRNLERDKEKRKLLRKLGWSVITLWECQLRNGRTRQACLNRFARRLGQP